MNQELTDRLIVKYPKQFQNLSYIECGDGWYDLLERLCYLVQNRIDYNTKQNKENNFFWSQIKQKFGGLRAYCYGADEYMRGSIDMAENMSYSICEVSGEKGKLRKYRKDDSGQPFISWIVTLSDKEAEKEGYIIDDQGFDADETD